MSNQSRRRFFQLAFGAGTVAALSPWLRSAWAGDDAAAVKTADNLKVSKRSSYALGTEISMLVLHEDEEVARKALDAAFGELETVETVMSIYRSESQISRLNRDGVFNDPHPYFLSCMTTALETSKRSDGAFDVTVQPLWNLYMDAKKKNTLPSDAEIETARRKVDWKKIEVSADKIKLAEKGMAITFNGIAQGFAADRCAESLKAHGIKHALVNAGEINSLGRKGDGSPWSVGIQHPRQKDAFIGLANLDGMCLSTSGDYATTFTDDFVYNHIFDPATGRSPLVFSSVTVVANNATDADALSTAIFVAGAERGMKLVEDTPGGSALLVFKDGKTFTTKKFPLAK
jgi:thiamine biosynthesis lipoprotein